MNRPVAWFTIKFSGTYYTAGMCKLKLLELGHDVWSVKRDRDIWKIKVIIYE